MKDDAPLWAVVEAAILAGGVRPVVDRRVAEHYSAIGQPAPGASDIDAAYAQIVDRWLTDAASDDETVHAYHVRLRQHLYQRAYQLNDFKTCLAVANDLAKLQSQYQRERAIRKRHADNAEQRRDKLRIIQGRPR